MKQAVDSVGSLSSFCFGKLGRDIFRHASIPTPSLVEDSLLTRKGRKRATRGAFSLIEVLIALTIFSFSILAIVGLMTVGEKTSRQSEEDTQSTLIARTLLDNIRFSAAYADLEEERVLAVDAYGRVVEENYAGKYGGGTADPRIYYLAKMTTKEVEEHPGLKEVTVSVESPAAAPASARKRYLYSTYLSMGRGDEE